ncbi:hypothetical protein ACIPM0_23870 [Pseudomonas sichuanensis]|uniref:hypothetical protein n=1 Tax=Pseudomonas TaxID=286 RepID=UPI0037F1FAF9
MAGSFCWEDYGDMDFCETSGKCYAFEDDGGDLAKKDYDKKKRWRWISSRLMTPHQPNRLEGARRQYPRTTETPRQAGAFWEFTRSV